MAVRTKEELLEVLRLFIGDRVDEDALTLLEDLSDTLSDLDAVELRERLSEAEQKLLEQEASWRKRYRDRFYDGDDGQPPLKTTHEQNEEPAITFESLFKED